MSTFKCQVHLILGEDGRYTGKLPDGRIVVLDCYPREPVIGYVTSDALHGARVELKVVATAGQPHTLMVML